MGKIAITFAISEDRSELIRRRLQLQQSYILNSKLHVVYIQYMKVEHGNYLLRSSVPTGSYFTETTPDCHRFNPVSTFLARVHLHYQAKTCVGLL